MYTIGFLYISVMRIPFGIVKLQNNNNILMELKIGFISSK